jgi:hypothetical protein
MKSSDRTILLMLGVLGVVAAFWFLLLAPKRQQASDLETDVANLQAEVTQAEQAAAAGAVAKEDFSKNYRELISLGKAVPVDADTPSLLTQLETLSSNVDVSFRSITLSGGSTETVAPAPTTTTPTDPAVASEASAALLPIGATVGPAGLPVMPYEMKFDGGFFEIADFFGSIDGMVESNGEKTVVDGRLLTIDGFNLAPSPDGLPRLTATVNATSYLTPADQGVTGGATAAGPAPEIATSPTTPPTDPSVAPTATVTP